MWTIYGIVLRRVSILWLTVRWIGILSTPSKFNLWTKDVSRRSISFLLYVFWVLWLFVFDPYVQALSYLGLGIVKLTLTVVKYDRLVRFNMWIISLSLSMDVLIISMMSLKNSFVYVSVDLLALLKLLTYDIDTCNSTPWPILSSSILKVGNAIFHFITLSSPCKNSATPPICTDQRRQSTSYSGLRILTWL